MRVWKKIPAVCLLGFSLAATHWGCGVKSPAAGTLSPVTKTFTFVILDPPTGTCPVVSTFDSYAPVTTTAGTVHFYPNVLLGSHTLDFSVSGAVTCSAGPEKCLFNGDSRFEDWGLGIDNAPGTFVTSLTDNDCG